MTTNTPVECWSDGIWTIKQLKDVTGKAFAELENHFDAKCNSFSDADLAVPKTIGPTLLDSNMLRDIWPDHDESWVNSGMCVLPDRPIVTFSFVGIFNRDANVGENKWWFMFCHRERELPIDWAATGPGYAYRCMVWCGWEEARNWGWYYTVDPATRLISPCRHRQTVVSPLPRRYRQGARSVQSTVWDNEKWWEGEPLSIDGETKISFGGLIAAAMNIAPLIDTHWRFDVAKRTKKFQKKPMRVQAIINPQLVVRLFKDRDKVEEVMTDAGRRRPILHWARAHYRNHYDAPRNFLEALFWRIFPRFRRVLKVSTVKTHLRGLREFVLDGFRCRIFLPGLHASTLQEVNLTSETIPEETPAEVAAFDAMDGDDAVDTSMLPKGHKHKKIKFYLGARRHELAAR
jgi:hypothetical protein